MLPESRPSRRDRRTRRARRRLLVVAGAVVVVIAAGTWWTLRPDDGAPESAASVSTIPPTTAPATVAPASGESTIPGVANDQIVNAEQVIVVNGTGGSEATLTAYEKRDGTWQQQFGPWNAVVGANGVAEADAKREGDGQTPSGSYPFDFFFGIETDPGVRFPYRQVTGSDIVWDDDSSSAHYNQWVDTSVDDAGTSPEPMDNSPVYDYGAVIAYNPERTPGLGSAIFLHVAGGSATAGCVALSQENLLELLRWLDPSRQPRIVIQPPSDVTAASLER